MIRTQIYLPDDIHANLLKIASRTGTTLSKLIREGAEAVLKRKLGGKHPQRDALRFFANVPEKYKTKLRGKELVTLVAKDRHE